MSRRSVSGRSSSARDAAIINARAEGGTLAEIGVTFGISRERVRQILVQQGPGTQNARSRMARAARQLAAAEVRRHELLAAWRAGLAPQEIAGRTGFPRACVNMVIESYAGAADHAARRRARSTQIRQRRPTFSDRQLIEAIRIAAEQAGRAPRGKEYVQIAKAAGLPSISTIENRFGGWNAAIRAAGLSPTRVRERPYPRRWTEEACLDALRALIAEVGQLPQRSRYVELARERPDLPSTATVRIRVGTWHAVARRLADEPASADEGGTERSS